MAGGPMGSPMPPNGMPGGGAMGGQPMGGGMMPQHGSMGHLPSSGSFEAGLARYGQAEAERQRQSEAEAVQMHADGQLLVGLLCAALYPQVIARQQSSLPSRSIAQLVRAASLSPGMPRPQVIALEREESKKKKGMNAPVKLRIRDRNEDGTGASDPVEVALHPSSVNAGHEKAIASSYLIYHEKVRTTRVYVRDCSPVSAYALILFGGVLSSQPGVPPPPPPQTKKNRHRQPPPQVRHGIAMAHANSPPSFTLFPAARPASCTGS